jgi:hypothetical protein
LTIVGVAISKLKYAPIVKTIGSNIGCATDVVISVKVPFGSPTSNVETANLIRLMSRERRYITAYVADDPVVINDDYVRRQNLKHSKPGRIGIHQRILDAVASVDRG